MGLVESQLSTLLGDEKVGTPWRPNVFVATIGIIGQDLARGWVYWHDAGLTELCPTDCKHALLEVDVVTSQKQRLADSQSTHRQQSQ